LSHRWKKWDTLFKVYSGNAEQETVGKVAMTDAEKLERVCAALGFGTALDARDNLVGAALDIDADENHVADEVSRQTITRVLLQLLEARNLLQP
jgi:hypothetical protein